MKKNIFYTLVALVIVAVVGCKDYLDVNTNPNQPTVTIPDLILSGALVETAREVAQDPEGYAPYWAGYWAASGTYSGAGDVRRNFILTNTSFQGVFNNAYANLVNYDFVLKASSAKGMENYAAICIIMKAYDFQMLVDNYGDVPYFSALKGFQSLSPKYDDAQTIYTDLSTKLDSAVALIQANPSATKLPATTDVMFAGDMTKWVKLANTLNLRLLLHQSNVTSQASFIQSEMGKIAANGGGFLTTDALINPGYTKAANLQNPFWESNGLGVGNDVGGRDYNRSSDYAVRYFVNNGDPRVGKNFRHPGTLPGDATGAAAYKGIPFGGAPDNTYSTSNTSGFGVGVMGSPSQSVPLLTAAESYFLQSEAAFRTANLAQSQYGPNVDYVTPFKAGVTASFVYLGLTAAQATAYLATTSADPTTLKGIIQQKWAANFSLDPMEAWTDLRRTGFPNDLPQSLESAKINPTPPVRLLYPQTEYNNNGGAVATAVQKQNFSDQFQTKIFWMP